MATRRTDDDDHEHSEALRYWYAQEHAPLPDTDPFVLVAPGDDRHPMPSGWWLAPAVALSLALWVSLGWLILG
jgi:hypothetical protein